MSRERQSLTGRLRFAPAVVGIALALAGCSAGQISQTAGMEPAVNGANGNVGPIAVRDVQLAYAENGVYKPGSDAVVLGSIFNSGQTDDELVSITSPAGFVVISGDRRLPAGRELIAELPDEVPTSAVTTTPSSPTTTGSSSAGSSTSSASSTGSSTSGSSVAGSGSASVTTTPTTTSSPAKPVSIGKVTIVISRLAEEVQSGKTIEMTFTFRGGQITVSVPVAVPATPRKPAVTEGR